MAWPVGLAAAGIGLYLCYLAVSRTQGVGSDGASIAVQAWDMLHGNPLLRGWTVTDVSFYTTELPEYMIVEAVRGLNADVLHASAAITYALVVLTGGLLGRGRATGREGIVRMFIAAGIMVAPQLGPGVYILIFQPDHIGTAVPLMLTWLVLDRAPRSWYVPPIIALMLAWGAIGDQLVLLVGVAPLAAVSAVRAYQVLVQRREGWRSGWFDVSLLAAAAAAVEISRIVVKEISAHGGYTVQPVPGGVAQVTEHVIALVAARAEHLRAVRRRPVRHVVDRAERGHRAAAPGRPGPGRMGPVAGHPAVLQLRGPHRPDPGRRHPDQPGRLLAQHHARDLLERARGGRGAAVRRGAGGPDAGRPAHEGPAGAGPEPSSWPATWRRSATRSRSRAFRPSARTSRTGWPPTT